MKMKLFPIVALTLGLWSCGGNGETEKPAEETAEPVTEEAASADQGAGIIDMADFQFHTMIANLPSPLETFHLISDVSVGMEGVPLTPTANAKNLGTMSAKAYGYGMYITDMGFMAYEHQNQQTLEYFQTCRDCLLYTSPSPRDLSTSRMPSSA